MYLTRDFIVQHLERRKKVSSKILVSSLCAMLLTSCAGPIVKQTFDLSDGNKAIVSSSVKNSSKQITVAPPDALQALDSQNIVIRGSGGSIAFLDRAQWSDRLTDIVQMRLVQALENTKNFSGVGRPGDGLNADYTLITELRSFDIEITAQGKIANVEIAVKLMDNKMGVIRKTHVFTANRPLAGTTKADYAVALSQAFNSTLKDIVAWAK